MRHGSPFEAYYYLATIQAAHARANVVSPHLAGGSCSVAVSFYKVLTERGVWDEDLLGDAEELWELGTERGHEMAMLRWWVAAERGNEVAQNNLAFVLDQGASQWSERALWVAEHGCRQEYPPVHPIRAYIPLE